MGDGSTLPGNLNPVGQRRLIVSCNTTTLVVAVKFPLRFFCRGTQRGRGETAAAHGTSVTLDFAAARCHRKVRDRTARLSRRRGQPLMPTLRIAARAALRPHTP